MPRPPLPSPPLLALRPLAAGCSLASGLSAKSAPKLRLKRPLPTRPSFFSPDLLKSRLPLFLTRFSGSGATCFSAGRFLPRSFLSARECVRGFFLVCLPSSSTGSSSSSLSDSFSNLLVASYFFATFSSCCFFLFSFNSRLPFNESSYFLISLGLLF